MALGMNTTPTRPVLRSIARRRAGGSIVINTAIALGLIVITLVGAELGYLFYVKRELQKTVDLAALAGAQRLTSTAPSGGCALALDAASANATQNLSGIAINPPECGSWKPDGPTGGNAGCFKDSTDHFMPNETPSNAVRVRIEKAPLTLLPFFSADRTICVQAVATLNEPQGSISVGSGVARLDAGLLNQLLSMLLGTSVKLSLVDYTGLLNAKLNLLGITDALGLNVGTYAELANANVNLETLLQAAILALPQSNDSPTADLATSVLNGLLKLSGGLNLKEISINLLKTAQQAGLLSIDLNTTDPRTALNGNVNALNLLLVALQVANSQSAIAAGIDIPLEPLAKVKLQAKIIEPPSIAVGPPGYYDPDLNTKAKTRAHTGQIRVLLDAQVLTPIAGEDLLNLLIVRVSLPSGQLIKLPIYVEVASGDAELAEIQCNAPDGKYDVKIAAAPGLAHIFLGKISPTAFTNREIPWKDLPKEQFELLHVKITILDILGGGIPIDVKVLAKLDVSIPGDESIARKILSYKFDPTIPASQQNLTQSVGLEQNLGAAIISAIGSNKLKLELDTSISILNVIGNGLITIVNGLLGVLNLVLLPVLTALDTAVLGPLLKTLGIQIGYADVQLLSASCDGNARLVY